MIIQLVVEGHGEVRALPVLLRRLQEAAHAWQLEFGRPVRRKSSDLHSKDRFQQGLRIALSQPDCAAVLVLFDLDDDCPKEAFPRLATWASEEARHVPSEVVLAHPEYEVWFLASVESLRGKRGIRGDAISPTDPENRRNAKSALEERMVQGRSYLETSDQAALSSLFDMEAAYRKSRSFRRMVKAFGELSRRAGCPIQEWPPRNWIQ